MSARFETGSGKTLYVYDKETGECIAEWVNGVFTVFPDRKRALLEEELTEDRLPFYRRISTRLRFLRGGLRL